uniref:Uncharacterized protein n=1 Tax=Tanacetum cinerariifolium TaxID=118510 RepID=A0A699KAH2_TANCI|nr:hypothetical protein [Tanacetum cinerariifolium]
MTSYAVAADLSEMELMKIIIEKMESNKSIHRSDKQRNLYKALVNWKRILKKNTKNKAKNDKTKHKMEKIKKDKVIRSRKVKSQCPRSTKVNPGKVKVNPRNVKVNPDKAEAEK